MDGQSDWRNDGRVDRSISMPMPMGNAGINGGKFHTNMPKFLGFNF
jgi:hypothetical protein